MRVHGGSLTPLGTGDCRAQIDCAHVLIFWRNKLKILSDSFFESVNAAPKAFGVTIAACFAVLFAMPETAWAHGFAGSRFFPATLSTDDPFVNDELSLPTVSTIVTPEQGGTRETEISADIAKRITPNFGVEIGESFLVLKPED